MTDSPPPIDLDAVLEEIRQAVEANTASGLYSAALESELQSHYARLLDREDGRDRFDSLRVSLDHLNAVRGFSASRIENTSSVRGGEVLHRTAAKMVSRQMNGLVGQLNTFTESLMPTLTMLVNSASDPRSHSHSDVIHELDSLQDRVALIETNLGRVMAAIDRLEQTLTGADGAVGPSDA